LNTDTYKDRRINELAFFVKDNKLLNKHI